MRALLPFSLLLNFSFFITSTQVSAQDISATPDISSLSSSPITSSSAAATTSFVSLTPEMSSSSVSSFFAALATATPLQSGEPAPGDAGSAPGSGDSNAGAAGSDSGSITISKGGIIAIIICVVLVVVLGVASSVLFYLAKKRSWEVRKTIRKSARRVATALTPRRSTFPRDVQTPRRSSRGLTKLQDIDEVPPTPKIRGFDMEKGDPKISSFEMSDISSGAKHSKWARKLGR